MEYSTGYRSAEGLAVAVAGPPPAVAEEAAVGRGVAAEELSPGAPVADWVVVLVGASSVSGDRAGAAVAAAGVGVFAAGVPATGVLAISVVRAGTVVSVGATRIRCGVEVGRGGATVGATGALVGATVGSGGTAVAAGGDSRVGVGGDRVGDGSGVSVGGSAVGSAVLVGTAAVASAASWAALTRALAPSKYIAVAKRNSTTPSENAAAPRLLRPSYQPQPWYTIPGQWGRGATNPLRRRQWAKRLARRCQAARRR